MPYDPVLARSESKHVNDLFARHPLLLVSLVKVVVLLFLLLTSLAYLVWFERKVAAHIQGRWGPYRTGPHGLLQPLADGVKFLMKEDSTPAGADRFVYFLAPFLTLTLAISTIALIPFGPTRIHVFGQTTPMVIADVTVGLLAIFALTSVGVYGVVLAGWSSNNKYSLLGGLRSSAQMISYELSLTLSIVGVLLLAGTFNLSEIVTRQSGTTWGLLPRWNLLSPTLPQLLGFFCYFVAAVAETNRLPFDLAEAESELVAGFPHRIFKLQVRDVFHGRICEHDHGFMPRDNPFLRWMAVAPSRRRRAFAWTHYLPAAFFAMAGAALVIHGVRYITAFGRGFVLPILGTSYCVCWPFLFARAGMLEIVQGPFWFLLKVLVVLFVYVWVRWTLPRFRYDQLMGIGWKLLLPLALANVVLTSLAVVIRK